MPPGRLRTYFACRSCLQELAARPASMGEPAGQESIMVPVEICRLALAEQRIANRTDRNASTREDTMPLQYEGIGIQLLYPDNWLVHEDNDTGKTGAVTIESPGGAFMTISRCENGSTARVELEKARQIMQREYDEVETESVNKLINERQLETIEQRFVYLDLIITSQLLTVSHGDEAYLIQVQGEDRELEKLRPVFDAMLKSLMDNL